MKILVDYDEVSGQLTYDNGLIVGNWLGLDHLEYKPEVTSPSSSLSELIQLKAMGIDTKDILELNKEGLLK